MKHPKISVIMSVYNTEPKILNKAIKSILKQTYSDFEFIIINDASDLNYSEIIDQFNDKRIKYYSNTENKGLTVNLNKAIDLSVGKYIARMDADDISMPKRFEKQILFLESNPQVGVLGTSAITIGNRFKVLNKNYTEHEIIKSKLIVNSPMIHPTIMARAELFKENKYDENCRTAQDYELWSRLIWKTKFANLKEVLLMYRVHDSQISVKKSENQIKTANITRKRMLRLIKPEINQEELRLFTGDIQRLDDLLGLRDLSNKLILENQNIQVYNEEFMEYVLSENLDIAHYIYTRNTQKMPVSQIKLSPKHKYNKYTFHKYIGPIIGCFIK